MARNWLRASLLLPSKFWWFAVKCATELQNILPINRKGTITMPHTINTGEKLDYWCLFLMFSTAYIQKPRVAACGEAPKWKPKILKCIVVRTCPKSDGLLFYHPPSKELLSCWDCYKFVTFHPSSPEFNLQYDNNFIINSRREVEYIHRPPSQKQNTTIFIPSKTNPNNFEPAHVLEVPINENTDTDIVQVQESGDIIKLKKDQIRDMNPDAPIKEHDNESKFPLSPWIRDGAKVTLFLPHTMQEPKQGYIYQNEDKTWYFKPGRLKTSKTRPIPQKNSTL